MENENYRKTIKEFIKKFNKNIAAITWFSTIVPTIIVVLLKFFQYVFERGRISFWRIDPSAIMDANDKTLYDIILMVVFGMILMVVSSAPALIIRTKVKIRLKVLLIILLHFLLALYIYINTKMWLLFDKSIFAGVFALFIYGVHLYSIILFGSGFVLVFGMLYQYKNDIILKENNSRKNINISRIIVVFALWFSLMSCLMYLLGYTYYDNKTKYRIVENEYAIVYENNNFYYLVKYIKANKTLSKENQKVINKEEIEFYWIENIEIK